MHGRRSMDRSLQAFAVLAASCYRHHDTGLFLAVGYSKYNLPAFASISEKARAAQLEYEPVDVAAPPPPPPPPPLSLLLTLNNIRIWDILQFATLAGQANTSQYGWDEYGKIIFLAAGGGHFRVGCLRRQIMYPQKKWLVGILPGIIPLLFPLALLLELMPPLLMLAADSRYIHEVQTCHS